MKQKIDKDLLFLGIDIGNSSCKVVLAQVESWDSQSIEILSAQSYPSIGTIETGLPKYDAVDRGSIVNMDKVSEVLGDAIQDVRNDFPDANIYTTFAIQDKRIATKINRARNPFSRHEREVHRRDLMIARDMASNAPLSSDRDYIHIITRHYRVDDRLPHKNPEGELGSSVEAEIMLASALKQEIAKYQECANRVGIHCDYICAGPVASGDLVLTTGEKEQGAVLIDVGSQVTGALLFEQNVPKTMTVIPLGSDDITRDLCNELCLSFDVANKVKCNYTCVDDLYLSEFNEIEKITLDEDGKAISLSTKQLFKIASARVFDILQFVYRGLRLTDNTEAYPVIFTGGGSRIPGIGSLTEKLTGAKVRLAQPWNWGGHYSVYRAPEYSTAVGVCSAGFQHYLSGVQMDSTKNQIDSTRNNVAKNTTRTAVHTGQGGVKNWFGKMGNKMRDFFSFGDLE